MRRLFALTCLLLSSALHAETYKWVDERGVVNYSNTPPPGTAQAPQKVVAERVSTVETDPALRPALYTGPSAYEVMQQQEWLQRQRLMAERQNVQTIYEGAPADPYGSYYYPGYYPVVSTRAVRRVAHQRQAQNRPTHHWR